MPTKASRAPLRPLISRRSIVSAFAALAALPFWARGTPVDPPPEPALELEPEDDGEPSWESDGRDLAYFGVNPLRESHGIPSAYYAAIRLEAGDPAVRPHAKKLGTAGERLELEFVPRWEAPEVIQSPQPEPLEVEVAPAQGQAPSWGTEAVTIWRTWDTDDVRHCRLCKACHAFPTEGDMTHSCDVHIPVREAGGRTIPLAAAVYWSQRHKGPLPGAEREAADFSGEDD